MAADWYCEIDGVQHGPVTAVQLKQLATDGKLQPAHPVWKEGMQARVPARSVKGLFDSAGQAATPVAEREQSAPAPRPKEEEDLVEFEMVGEEPAADLVELEEIEPIEEEPVKAIKEKDKGKKEEVLEEEPEPELIAEVAVIYREGLPDLDGPVYGMLQVESTGLRFLFEEDGEEDEYGASPFKKVESILEPAKGDFPPSMKKKALGKKIGGTAGKLAAGMVGKWDRRRRRQAGGVGRQHRGWHGGEKRRSRQAGRATVSAVFARIRKSERQDLLRHRRGQSRRDERGSPRSLQADPKGRAKERQRRRGWHHEHQYRRNDEGGEGKQSSGGKGRPGPGARYRRRQWPASRSG